MKAAIVALAGCLAGAASADFDAASYPPYERCALCHGLFGQSHLAKFPHLAGQKQAYIQAQLSAFYSGARTNDGGQMASIVTELLPDEYAVVVAWFAEQDPPAASEPVLNNAGAVLAAEYGCESCHNGDAGNDAPHLTAQHQAYLAKQIGDFRDGRRNFSGELQIHSDFDIFDDQDVEDLAAYFATLERPQ